MSDRRRHRGHRGQHPADAKLFGRRALPALRAATAELSWLLGRGYAYPSSTKLVGDRHQLTARQREAIARAAASDQASAHRERARVDEAALRGQTLLIDGFNVLTTLEVALSGGVVLLSRDGTLRDIAGVHGSYRRVQETAPALSLIGELASALGVTCCRFLLDRPVSNSGRLRAFVLEHAAAHGFAFEAEVVPNPDRELVASEQVVASADGEVLDHAARWFNLVRVLVGAHVPDAFVVDLSCEASPSA